MPQLVAAGHDVTATTRTPARTGPLQAWAPARSSSTADLPALLAERARRRASAG